LDEYLNQEPIMISEDTPPTIPDHVKAQLQRLINHLELDISILVKDAGSIREIFNQIKDDIPSPLKEMIQPASFLEGNGPRFLSTQSRSAARESQKNSALAEGECIHKILSIKKTVNLLKESPAEINKDLAALNEERTQLLAPRKSVEDAIKLKEEALSEIPASLANQKRNMTILKTKLDKTKQDKKAKILGSAEEDQQQIAEIDNIRLWL